MHCPLSRSRRKCLDYVQHDTHSGKGSWVWVFSPVFWKLPVFLAFGSSAWELTRLDFYTSALLHVLCFSVPMVVGLRSLRSLQAPTSSHRSSHSYLMLIHPKTGLTSDAPWHVWPLPCNRRLWSLSCSSMVPVCGCFGKLLVLCNVMHLKKTSLRRILQISPSSTGPFSQLKPSLWFVAQYILYRWKINKQKKIKIWDDSLASAASFTKGV